MAAPSELSLEAIRVFMLENGGKVTNHDLVKHFKPFLTNPETRVEARNQFKEFVNTVATIRNDEGEKYLVLKKRYRMAGDGGGSGGGSSIASSPSPSLLSVSSAADSLSGSFETSPRQPPPYRAPPPPLDATPPVPPRRKSSDKLRLDGGKENAELGGGDCSKRPKTIGAEATAPMDNTENVEVPFGDISEGDLDHKISVKERMQRFNRLATEGEQQRALQAQKKKNERGLDDGGDDGDTASVTSLDARAREWLVLMAQGDHLALTKLASANPRLARFKDPTSGYNALHWAAKHGNTDMIKLIAGTYSADVNVRTNGGYTPAHIAMQFGHENVFNLLVQVYEADPNLRDWSGRKPRQYQASQDTAVSADTFRKIKARKKHSEKDLSFLRIGSLNVRVKRTTEAFSNFLGVTVNSDKLHKSWGSADNIQQVDHHNMVPPKMAPIKKRRSRRGQDFSGSHSTPSTPPSLARRQPQDSDSDTAAGFGTDWQGTA